MLMLVLVLMLMLLITPATAATAATAATVQSPATAIPKPWDSLTGHCSVCIHPLRRLCIRRLNFQA